MQTKALPNKPLAFIFFFAKKQPWFFILMASVAVLWAINETIYPFFIKLFVDQMNQLKPPIPHLWATFALPLVLWLGVWTITALALRFQGLLAGRGFAKLRASVREAVFYYLGYHSHQFFSDRFSGSLASKVADLATGAQTIAEIFIYNFIATTVFLVSVFILLSLASPIFSGILALWVVVHFTITLLSLKKVNHFAEKHADSTSRLSGKITDAINNILTIRIFASMHYELKYLNKYQMLEQRRAWEAAVSLEKVRLIQDLSTIVALSAMFGGLLISWQHNKITVGNFTLVAMLTFSALMYVWWCAFQFGQCVREIGKIQNALTELLEGHDIIDMPNAPALKINHPEIVFENINFGFDETRPLLFQQLNLRIKAGEKIGLVGFSGAGKTTFIQLLLRFYDLQGGAIYIDGQDIAKVSQDSLRRSIAMIPQESMLFHRSLMENIRYGNLGASDEDVIAAAKAAECHEFISSLPQTYQTLVGERGIKLSGGQRQRIAIARAVLKQAPILILDEATAALDSVTEDNIQASLMQIMQGVTSIVIAHRLSTLAHMDRILVFSHGKIIEDGSMQTLLAKQGHFTELWEKQKNGFIPG